MKSSIWRYKKGHPFRCPVDMDNALILKLISLSEFLPTESPVGQQEEDYRVAKFPSIAGHWRAWT